MSPAQARRQRAEAPPGRSAPLPDDPELLARLAQGDLAALGELYDRYHGDVRAFVRRAAGHGEADDLVHETFLTLARAAGSYDGRGCARPFLFGIAAQLLRRRRRSLARLANGLRRFAVTLTDAVRRTPEDAAADSEQLRRFDHGLGQLTPEKRVVFLMIERGGMKGEEVATALGLPVATVWTRLHYARQDLRAALTKGRVR